ncbi:MAG: aldose 1-epimerase family protein [Opitutales bacterium]|nr:aldose 1-epimerase family protein [Opitutales bacterium]
MKSPALSLLCFSFLLFSCSENQDPLPEPMTQLNQSEVIQYLESSTSHPDHSFATDWSVTSKILRGGKQEGVELLTLDNGKLQISIIPTRGMGIFDVRSAGVRLGWNSPVKEIVHPSHINLDSRGGLGWLEGFNEWMVRCGLEFAGHPGTDEFIDNTGNPSTLNLTLHGKIQNIPASSYKVVIDPEPPHRIRVRGTVYEKFFYGPKLKLVTEISTVPGSESFQISDQITNEGAFAQEFQLIYHGNYGSSILEEGATVFTPARSVTPMNDHAAKGIDNWKTYLGPTPGFIEEVYLLEPQSDGESNTLALLANADRTLATSVRWNLSELPYLTIWKNTAAKEDGYVTGIEPATGYPFNRKVERKYGRVPMIQPGETLSFSLGFGIHQDEDSIQSILAEIDELQKNSAVVIHREPPVTE